MAAASVPQVPSQTTDKVDFTKPVETANLKGKSVIVTGGASGIGAGSVLAYAEAGAHVTILDLNENAGVAYVEQLRSKGHNVQFVKTDVTSFSSQNEGFKAAIAFSPNHTIDIVLASAGITTHYLNKWLADNADSDDPEPPSTATLDINLTGSFYTAHLALHYFKKTTPTDPPESGTTPSSKQIIFMGSVAGYIALDNIPDYQASKFGVRGVWKTIRDLRNVFSEHTPLRSNLIAPVFIDTPLIGEMIDRLRETGHRLAEVDDVVAAIIRVSCDETIYGKAISVAQRSKTPGDNNFELRDDWEGYDGGLAVAESLAGGKFDAFRFGRAAPGKKAA